MNRFICLILSVLFSLYAYAQKNVYNGIVCQANSKQPIEFVSVCLLAKDSTIINYAYTDKNGHFELAAQAHAGKALSFSYMGYKKVVIPLADFTNASRIMLEEDVYKIQEVKISSNRIRQRKDTLIYSVSGFKMPQDRSIEDVLKKIPGIEVTTNGQIKFQNKPISHFYIDGMNLLDGKYALASKNIPANMVKEVQVLQSHQPIATLRGKSFSDNAALNLTLESEAKNHLIGMIDMGLGMDQKNNLVWDNRLMGMLFGKKMQNLTMYKNNNTGKDIANEINALALKSVESASQMDSENDFFSTQATAPKGIAPSRYLSNNAHLIAVNHLYKIQKEKDLRLQLVALHDKQSAMHEMESTYFYPSQTVVINEQEQYRGVENRIEAEMSYTQNDSNVYIENTLRGTASLHKSELSLITNAIPTHVYSHPQRKLLQNNFHLIKSNKRHSVSFYSNNSYTELPQYMTVSPGLYEELLTGGQPYSCFQQNALLRTFKSDSYTYFQHKIGTFYLKYRAGIIYENRYLQSLLYTDTHLVDNKDYSNKVRLETVETYIEPSLNLKTAYWDLQFRFPLTYHYSKLKNTLPHLNTESKHKLLPTPSLNLKYNLNAYWNISATSTLGFLKPDIRRLYAGYLFDTYRSAQSFTQGLIYDKNMYNLLRLRYNNPLNGLFISFNGIFSQTWQDYIYIYNNQEDILSVSQSRYYPNSKKNYGGSIRLSKATGWSKLFTALSASYNKIDDNIMLENDLVKSTLSFLSLGADVSLQPSRYINIEASSRATNVQSKLDLDTPTAVQTWSYEHLLNVNLIFSSKWRASMENFLTHNNQSKYLTYFADASVTYTLKKWLFELELHNIFNHSTLYNNYISNWTQQTSKYSLRQREVLLKTAFSF